MSSAIVCGIDHSDQARSAAHCAAALARRLQQRLILVHAVPATARSAMPAWPYPASLDYDAPRQGAQESARWLTSRVREDVGAPEAVCRVEEGSAAERLTAIADEEDAALIVVGTQGEGTARAVLLGSVSLATVRAAGRPVVVVPPAVTRRRAAVEGDCVLCAVAGPADTRHARVAAEIARGLGLPVQLAHVAPPQDEDLPGGTVSSVPLAAPEQLSVRLVDEGREALEEAAGMVAGIADLDRVRLLAGDPAEQLDRLARRERAALLVAGTRARGALRSALLGSVSRSLACTAGTPVVVCSQRALARAEDHGSAAMSSVSSRRS